MLSGGQKAVPMRADGLVESILHLGSQNAVLHQDGRAKIPLIVARRRCGRPAEKAATA